MSKTFGFFLGLLSGAVAGGIAVLLLTPKTGHELRDELQDDLDNIAHDVEHTFGGNYILLEKQPRTAS